MITEEEFKQAQKIVDQYHAERQQEADNDLDEDSNDWEEDEDDIENRRQQERAELAFACTCGAWVFNSNKTSVLHVADCICGAE